MSLWLLLFGLSATINSGGGASRGLRRAWDVVAALLLAFVTSAVAIGVQVVALFKGNPHRFEVIQKTDPRGRKPGLVMSSDVGEAPPSPEPVVVFHDQVVVVPEAPEPAIDPDDSRHAADGGQLTGGS